MLTKFESKYYGGEVAISKEDPILQETYHNLLICIAEIKASKWQALSSELEKCVNHLESGRVPMYRFQVELINDVFVPYVRKLNNRYHTDEARERQLAQILHVATLPVIRHPADALLLVDKVAYQIRMTTGRKFFSFKSELMAALDLYRDKKWRPLLWETKSFLQSVGAKLLGVGLVGLVGWPLALLYPMMLSTKQLSTILRELDQTKTLSSGSIFQLARLALITFASLQLVSVLQAYASVGYMAVLAAALFFITSTSDEAMKHIIPALAPYADMLDGGSGFSLSKLADILHRQEFDAAPTVEQSARSPLPPSSVKIEVFDEASNAYVDDYDEGGPISSSSGSSSRPQSAYSRSDRDTGFEPQSETMWGEEVDQTASGYATRLRKRKTK